MDGFNLEFIKYRSKTHGFPLVNIWDDFEKVMTKLMQYNNIRYCYEEGYFKIAADYFEIWSDDLEHIIYTFDLNHLPQDEIYISLRHQLLKDVCDELYKETKEELRHCDMLDLGRYVQVCWDIAKRIYNDERIIFTQESRKPEYNRIFSAIMTVEDSVLRIEKNVSFIDKELEEKKITKRNNEQEEVSGLYSIILGDFLTINAFDITLLQTLKTLEEQNIEYEVKVNKCSMRGHYIEIPCLEISGEDFTLFYESGGLMEAYIYNDMLKNSYFITTKGVKHNMGDIVRDKVGEREYVYINGYGADDAWHYAGIDRKGNYFYSVGCNR